MSKQEILNTVSMELYSKYEAEIKDAYASQEEFFESINRTDIDEKSTDLLASGLIDSMDIISLASAIKNKYGKKMDARFLKAENFKNFDSITKMIEEYLKTN